MGAVKSMAISENGILASGSSDETVQLFNLVKGVQLGSLFFHNGWFYFKYYFRFLSSFFYIRICC